MVDVKKNSVPRRSFNDIFYDLAEHMWKNLSVAEFEVKVQRAIDQGFPIDFVSSSDSYENLWYQTLYYDYKCSRDLISNNIQFNGSKLSLSCPGLRKHCKI